MRFALTRPGRKESSPVLRAYPCRICAGWHLSSKPLAEVITAPPGAKRKTSTLPTRRAGSRKLAAKRPAGGQSKRRRATVL